MPRVGEHEIVDLTTHDYVCENCGTHGDPVKDGEVERPPEGWFKLEQTLSPDTQPGTNVAIWNFCSVECIQTSINLRYIV